jgi:predicted transcriptional regulator
MIRQVLAALMRVSSGGPETPLEPAKPAVSVKKSMTPEQYRDKWGLPPDYPMVAPNYAVARSQLAKKMGLGQQARKRK